MEREKAREKVPVLTEDKQKTRTHNITPIDDL